MTDRLASLTRLADRGSEDRAALDELLDSQLVGVLSTVLEGQPWSVPMLFARDGDRVILHGSTGAGALRQLAAGAPATLTVFALDGLVVAYNAFDSSANYRSAVLRGSVAVIAGEEARTALATVTDRLLPGRTREVVASTRRELAATTVLALPITPGSWLFKQRRGGSTRPEGRDDLGDRLPWTGVVPMALVAGEPVPDEWNTDGAALPPSVAALRRAFP